MGAPRASPPDPIRCAANTQGTAVAGFLNNFQYFACSHFTVSLRPRGGRSTVVGTLCSSIAPSAAQYVGNLISHTQSRAQVTYRVFYCVIEDFDGQPVPKYTYGTSCTSLLKEYD